MYLGNMKYDLCIIPGKITTENEISSQPVEIASFTTTYYAKRAPSTH